MKTITVNASVTYDVIIGKDVINMLPEKITEKFAQAKVMIVTDDKVASFYSDRVKNILLESGVLKPTAPYYLTHFSEFNMKDTHEILCEEAKKYDMIVAYDGMTVEF